MAGPESAVDDSPGLGRFFAPYGMTRFWFLDKCSKGDVGGGDGNEYPRQFAVMLLRASGHKFGHACVSWSCSRLR